MFDTKISIFKTFDAEPKTITLAKWLKVCTKGSKFAKHVKRYRQSGDQQIKKSLPLATVGAVCEGGRRLENVTHRTGWIALDIDAKDNPHIKDAAALRDRLGNIVYVAFAGLSVSGEGVWALVKVKHPQKQPEHFEQLIIDFASRGITLDSTKGKNPNDARFYSYDPAAYIAKNFRIYDRLPVKRSSGHRSKGIAVDQLTGNSDRYGQAAFEDEINILSGTPKGERNTQLFKSTANLAELVAGGVLSRHEVEDALHHAAQSIGLPEYEIKATIKSGFKAGMKNPRTPDNSVRVNHAPARDRTSQAKYESQHPAPYGYNPYTGEVFDQRGYPADWDDPEIQAQYEYEQLKQADPKIALLEQLFDAEPITKPV